MMIVDHTLSSGRLYQTRFQLTKTCLYSEAISRVPAQVARIGMYSGDRTYFPSMLSHTHVVSEAEDVHLPAYCTKLLLPLAQQGKGGLLRASEWATAQQSIGGLHASSVSADDFKVDCIIVVGAGIKDSKDPAEQGVEKQK